MLDPADRSLTRDGAPVELNARYLDALALMVDEAGRMVSKDRFLDEVWRGVPVTDEALTQCVRSLRRALGDDAVRPRFIETVPKHGYRFIAPVERVESQTPAARPSPVAAPGRWNVVTRLGRAGMIGGGAAGLVGGVVYGVAATVQPGGGAVSALLILAGLTALIGLLGGMGVAFGVALAEWTPSRRGAWRVLGGAAGGMLIGAVVKLFGLDAFALLFGQIPVEITGAPEGALLGAAVGLAAALSHHGPFGRSRRLAAGLSALISGAAGVAIALLGGRLMGGSLDALADRFPASRLRLDAVGPLVGEPGFGVVSQIVTAGLEAALFGACVVAALRWRPD